MKRIMAVVAVSCFAATSLLVFHIPEYFKTETINGGIEYAIMAGVFLYFIYAYKLPTLQYFRFPKVSISSALGLGVVVLLSYIELTGDDILTKPLWPTITGVFYLFGVGAGEEMVSRGFAFGALKRNGNIFALIFSSLIFGLMHLNLYVGADWDPVTAYWHCLSASGFGFLAACVMIVTRSIYPAIALHALTDWSVVFHKPYQDDGSNYVPHFDPLWQTIKDSFAQVGLHVILGLILLLAYRLSKIKDVPKFLVRPLLRLGLIQADQ